MKRIVIAGGTGLIGKALVNRLIEKDYEVVILSRKEPQEDSHPKFTLAQWDGKNLGDWVNYLDGAAGLINLAGENIGAGYWTPERKRRIRSSRVDAGRVLIQALEKVNHKPPVLLQASAIGFYGPAGSYLLNENSPAGTDFSSGICLDWEASTLKGESMGIRRAVLRTGIVLSLQAGALPPLLLPIRWFVGGPLGSGKQYWSWIMLEDVVEAMLTILENEKAAGLYNLTAPEPVTMDEMGRSLASLIKRPFWLPAPAFALRLLLGEMSSLVLDSQRISPDRLLQMGYKFKYPALQPALQVLLS